MTRVILTAGFDRAAHVVALATLLERDDVTVVGVLVVGVLNVKRLRAYARQRGRTFVWEALRRLRRTSHPGVNSPLADFLLENRVFERSLKRWCKCRNVAYKVVRSLDEPEAATFVRGLQVDGVLYGGGGILRAPFIDAANGRILNAHHGPLPYIRGMNACEWSLLLHQSPAVTIHYIDRGIDTGPVVGILPVSVVPGDTLASLRERCTVTGLEGLRRNVRRLQDPIAAPDEDRSAYKQVYTLAPALREVLAHRLARDLKETGGDCTQSTTTS